MFSFHLKQATIPEQSVPLIPGSGILAILMIISHIEKTKKAPTLVSAFS